MVSQIPALYGSGKLESRYMFKAHSIEKLLMFNGNGEWDGSFRVRELSKNEKLRKLLSSILPHDQYSFSDEDRSPVTFDAPPTGISWYFFGSRSFINFSTVP